MSRPTVIELLGRTKLPASVPSARSAVSFTAPGGCARSNRRCCGRGRRCGHEGHVVSARRAELVARRVDVSTLRARHCAASGSRCCGGWRCGSLRSRRNRDRHCCGSRRWSRRRGRCRRLRGRAHSVRRRLRGEGLRCRITRQLGTTAETKLVMVLVLLRALGAGDHRGASSNETKQTKLRGHVTRRYEPTRSGLGASQKCPVIIYVPEGGSRKENSAPSWPGRPGLPEPGPGPARCRSGPPSARWLGQPRWAGSPGG